MPLRQSMYREFNMKYVAIEHKNYPFVAYPCHYCQVLDRFSNKGEKSLQASGVIHPTGLHAATVKNLSNTLNAAWGVTTREIRGKRRSVPLGDSAWHCNSATEEKQHRETHRNIGGKHR